MEKILTSKYSKPSKEPIYKFNLDSFYFHISDKFINIYKKNNKEVMNEE
jgi:hypothetical protein